MKPSKLVAIAVFLIEIAIIIISGYGLFHKVPIHVTPENVRHLTSYENRDGYTVIRFRTYSYISGKYDRKLKVILDEGEVKEYNKTKTVYVTWFERYSILLLVLWIIGTLLWAFLGIASFCFTAIKECHEDRNLNCDYCCNDCPLIIRCRFYQSLDNKEFNKWYSF